MEITGDARVFAVINTANYNGDGRWCIQTATMEKLPDLGFDKTDTNRIENLRVDDVLGGFDYEGVLVVRIA